MHQDSMGFRRALLKQHQSLCVPIRSVASHTLPPHADQASLYVHWPYCLKRCSYCNFNKYIPRSQNHEILAECLLKETQTLLLLSQVSRISSVFFGGGTPSLAHPSTIAAVLEAVSKNTHLSDDAEVTLEVNPTPAGKASLKEFMLAGVNRFSIGVQSLSDHHLRILGRDHNSQHALRTVSEARTLCPDVSDFGKGHPAFKQVESGDLSVPGDDVTAVMYKSARGVLEKAGFCQYEVSNFAKNNAVSEHNMGYWRGHQYIGVGPGAHGRFVPRALGGAQREARTQTLEPDVWIREVQRHGHGTRRRKQFDHRGLLEEVLVMGLRMSEGITHQHWEIFSPKADLQKVFGMSENIQEFQAGGLLILNDRGLRCSWEGLALLDSILPTMLLELEMFFQKQQKHRHSEKQTTVYIRET